MKFSEKDFDVTLGHDSKKDIGNKLELGTVNVAGYYKHGKYQVGVRGSYTHAEKEEDRKTSVALGGIAKVDDKHTVKAKVDLDANVSLSWKHVCSKHITTYLSTGANLKVLDKFVQDSRIPVPLGVQLDFSY